MCEKKIKSSVPKLSEMGRLHPEPSHDRRFEQSFKQIHDIAPFWFRCQRRQQASVNVWQTSVSVNYRPNKTCEHNLKSSSNTSSNAKLISYWKVRLQITDFNEPTSVHPVGSKSDWFPPLGGIKYVVSFCGKSIFNCYHWLQPIATAVINYRQRDCGINEISH